MADLQQLLRRTHLWPASAISRLPSNATDACRNAGCGQVLLQRVCGSAKADRHLQLQSPEAFGEALRGLSSVLESCWQGGCRWPVVRDQSSCVGQDLGRMRRKDRVRLRKGPLDWMSQLGGSSQCYLPSRKLHRPIACQALPSRGFEAVDELPGSRTQNYIGTSRSVELQGFSERLESIDERDGFLRASGASAKSQNAASLFDTEPEPSTFKGPSTDSLDPSVYGSHSVNITVLANEGERSERSLGDSSVASSRDGLADGENDDDVIKGESCSTSLAEHREKYWKGLIDTENWEALHLDRAGSVTDSHVLRRKGHLKEQDGLIDFIISMHRMLSPYEVMEKVEQWVLEHRKDHKRSTLKRLIPSVGKFYTSLRLVDALQEYDEFASLSRRRYVPPNFAEIRHILNIAQLHSSAEGLSLITFDADGTLYADGHHMKDDNKMIGHIIALMKRGIHVAIVTAAGYPGDAGRFEGRLAGLLAAFEALQLPPATTRLFHVMGGECNYLLRVNGEYRLEFVDDTLWKLESMLDWSEADVTRLLDDAEAILRSASARLRVPVAIVRKERAVGICPVQPTIYEVLEEVALTVQSQLVDSKLPFCAFNGGKDVFVDVGNKSLGMAALMQYLQKKPEETLHVGDRFTVTGNDGATRSRCSILWVANPEETAFFTRMLLRDIHRAKLSPYLE